MKCRRARQLLFDFVDGLGSEALRAELDFHLGECSECERFASELTRSLDLLKRMPAQALDDNFNWKVRLAIHRERNAMRASGASPGAWARSWNLRYVVSASVAFAAVLVVGAGLRDHVVLPGPAGMQTTVASQERPAETTPPRQTSNVSYSFEQHPLVPRGNAGPTLVGFGGDPSVAQGAAPQGAIDPSASDAVVDSLIEQQLQGMVPTEQVWWLQRLSHRIDARMQQSQQNVSGRH